MPGPKYEPDEAVTRDQAVKLARHAARRLEEADRKFRSTLLFAVDNGASLRELADATGRPHTTIRDIVDRERKG